PPCGHGQRSCRDPIRRRGQPAFEAGASPASGAANGARSPVGRGEESSPFLLDLHHVAYDPEHAAQLRTVGPPGLAADPTKPEGAKRPALLGACSIGGARLLDDEVSHLNYPAGS